MERVKSDETKVVRKPRAMVMSRSGLLPRVMSGRQLCSSQSARSVVPVTTKGYEDGTAQSWLCTSFAVVIRKVVPAPQLATQQR